MAGPPLHLVITLPGGEVSERVLEEGPVLVGRSPQSGLQIRDALLSRQHARLLQEAGGWRIEDLDSHNGTLLNERRVHGTVALNAGDVLLLGGTRIAVRGAGSIVDLRSVTGAVFHSAAELLHRPFAAPEAAGPEELLRHADRLKVLLEVHQALSRPIALQDLLDLILDRLIAHMKPDQAAIYLRRPDGSATCAASRPSDGMPRSFVISTHLLLEVAEKGMAAYVPNVVLDDRFSEAQSLLNAGVQTLLAAPLLDSEGSLGMVVLSSGAGAKGFKPEDLDLLVSLASAATLRIRNVALAEEALERRRLADEMALARQIQQGLLPESLPQVEGWEFFALNRASDVVSGDLYTALDLGDPPKLALMIADVAGKGVTASLLTASLEALFAGPVEAGLPPDQAFAQISEQLYRRTPPERYATGFLGVLDPGEGRLRFANAGHVPALVVEAGGGHRWLRARGFPLGLMPGAKYERGEEKLAPGELLVLLTDGFTEAFSETGEEFGQERVLEACLEFRDRPLAEIAAHLEKKVDAFTGGAPPSDDRTLMLLRRASAL
jgi:sigma-B regulation protein RsbU (phosphoserine phosphatase)